jgi:hypothetical protein
LRPQRLRARAKAPWERGEQPPLVSKEEAATLSMEQLAFLDRKARAFL